MFENLKRFKVAKDEEKKEPDAIKLSKPKILMVDMLQEKFSSVRENGFNVSFGTSGSVFKVEISDRYKPVILNPHLPEINEQEIVIIDLSPPLFLKYSDGKKYTPDSESDWWIKCSSGLIDTRPRTFSRIHDSLRRILKTGGCFVVFADVNLNYNFVLAKINNNIYGHNFVIERPIHASIWSFCNILFNRGFSFNSDSGEEIHLKNVDHVLNGFLKKHKKNAKFKVTITFNEAFAEDNVQWTPIATNKFGNEIAGIIRLANEDNNDGYILLLPQLDKNSDMILDLLNEVIPEVSPHLFPHLNMEKWVEGERYEISSILSLKNDQEVIKKETQKKIEDINRKIEAERDKYSFLHGILTQTDDDLVKSVKKALEFIGFEKVVDVDEVENVENKERNKQEDLQILDKSPSVIAEVKGLTNLPHEAHTLQVIKYVPRRMKEWGRTDVVGISVINHQRNIPALERENNNVFTNQQIEDAQHYDLTLISTWDLFLLIRGMIDWNWNREELKKQFYKKGRFSRIPDFYKPLGKVVHYWDNIGVVSIDIESGKLTKGQRIGYVLPGGYLEETVESMQIEKEDVNEAAASTRVGIKTGFSKDQIKKNISVFLVN